MRIDVLYQRKLVVAVAVIGLFVSLTAWITGSDPTIVEVASPELTAKTLGTSGDASRPAAKTPGEPDEPPTRLARIGGESQADIAAAPVAKPESPPPTIPYEIPASDDGAASSPTVTVENNQPLQSVLEQRRSTPSTSDAALPANTATAPTSTTTTTNAPTSTRAATTAVPRTTTTTVSRSSTSAPTSPTTTTKAPTTTTTTTTTTTAAPITSTPTTTPIPQRTRGEAGFIAPSAPTYIPVYDTAWQMLVRATPAQADQYFAALKAHGFTGTWSGIIHHAPATYNLNFAGGGQVGRLENGQVVLSDAYVAHVRSILDAADRHGMKVGLVAAWQNLYLPGGGADSGVGTSDAVRGTITASNARAYGHQIANAFGDHPAVSMWVFGGDAGTNNTEANKAVWREMATGVRNTGNQLSITYHTPTSEFDQLNYAGEPWLDFISPETGHAQDAATTEAELRAARSAYGLPVWQGEPRYFNINFDWVKAAFRNPGANEVRADAQAAENAGVSGYVYGDAGRWTWCAGYGDSTPCDPNAIAASFGEGERAVIEVFSG